MTAYVIRRVLQFIPVLIGTLFLIHYITSIGIQITGNPVRSIFGSRQPPPQVLKAVTARFGLADPCLDQPGNPCLGLFWDRITNYARGNLGTDFRGREVTDLLARRWPLTGRLTVLAVFFETLIGVPLGILAALRRNKPADINVRSVTVLLTAIPVFILAVLVQMALAVWVAGWFNANAWVPDWLNAIFAVTYKSEFPWLSLVIPALVLGALSLATIARLLRTQLLENLGSDYVRTAKSKGLRRRRVIGVHTLRNSLIPVVTYIGLDFGFLLTGALIVEGIFNIPGVGQLVFQAVQTGVVTITIPVVTLLVLIFLVFNLLVDIAYGVLDPRIRYA